MILQDETVVISGKIIWNYQQYNNLLFVLLKSINISTLHLISK